MPLAVPAFTRLQNLYERELTRLLRTFGGRRPLTPVILRRIAADPQFKKAAWDMAKKFAAAAGTANAASWREAAFKSTRAGDIWKALKKELRATGVGHRIDQVVAANAHMISSVPLKIAESITAYAAKVEQRGGRASEIEAEVRRMSPSLAKSRIQLIARTEVGKAESAVTRARSEEIGADWFQWSTAEDERVRPSHKNLNLVLVRWADLPQPEMLIGERSTLGPGAPGEFPNCRCASLPLISLDEVTWPARVYSMGSIKRMTRAAFKKFASWPQAA
jgi:SPP1 gp7 family putative phage head morphogenesis protein